MKNRIRFISVCENIDTAVKEDDFVPFRNIMNDWYAKDISTKTKASLYTKAKAGERMITVPIYGYKYDENKQWIIDEPAAEIVRRIFRMYLSGVGISTIARTLTEEGVDRPLKYKRGQDSEFPDWSRESIRSILTHQEYCGDTVNFKTLKLSYKSKKQIRRPKEEYLIFLDTHPAIITREEYEDISMLLEQQKRQTNKKSRKESLLRGFLICGDCNCNLIAQHAKVKTGFSTSYVCSTYHHHFRRCTSHSINEKLIIAKLIDTLQKLTEMYRNGELISYLDTVVFDDVKREQNETNEQLIKVNKRLEEIDVVIKNLYATCTTVSERKKKLCVIKFTRCPTRQLLIEITLSESTGLYKSSKSFQNVKLLPLTRSTEQSYLTPLTTLSLVNEFPRRKRTNVRLTSTSNTLVCSEIFLTKECVPFPLLSD